jgi:hypothetical protein
LGGFREHLVWVVAGTVSVAAAVAAASRLSDPTPVDQALGWIAAAVGVAGWLARGSRGAVVASLALPLLVLSPIAAGSEQARLLLYGLAYALAVSAAAAAALAAAAISRRPVVLLLLLIAVPFRGVAAAITDLPAIGLAVGGSVLLLLALRPSAAAFFVAAAAAVATPVDPPRAALFPLILAALAVRSAAAARVAMVVAAALVAGRWAWPFIAVAALHWAAEGWLKRGAARGLLVPLSGVPHAIAAALRGASFFPEAFAERTLMTVLPVAVLVAGMFLRPPLAVLYGLAAVTIALRETSSLRVPATPAVIGALILVLLPWSGVLVGAFPLPLSDITLAAIVAVTLVAGMAIAPRIRLVSAGLAVAVLLVAVPRWTEPTLAPAVLAPGQSATLVPPLRRRHVELAMSGGSMAALRRGTTVGTLDVIDTRGRAYRRSIIVGDLSDWAALRRPEYWRNGNGVPAFPAGAVAGHGAGAFLNGSGGIRVRIPDPIATVRVTASSDLPPAARLHIDSVRVSDR